MELSRELPEVTPLVSRWRKGPQSRKVGGYKRLAKEMAYPE